MAISKWFKTSCQISIAYYLVPIASADNGINWAAVGISWVFSMITTVVIVAISAVIIGRKKQQPEKVIQADENQPFRRELSVLSDASDMTRISEHSTQPLYIGTAGYSGGYRRVATRESNVNRRKSDFISTWCNQNGLSEVIAANLRENGFTSQEQVNSLRPGDVTTLGLPNLAQQVQLRETLEKLRKCEVATEYQREKQREPTEYNNTDEKGRCGSSSRPVPHNRNRSGSGDRSSRSRSSTDDNGVMSMPSRQAASPSNVTSSTSQQFQYPRGRSGIQEAPHISTIHDELPNYHKSQYRLDFNGLLSDSGLYELAECLGAEWRHLAAVLGLGKAQQEHLLNDYPNNTKQQIHEMLRQWREGFAKDGKEQVKAQLAEALTLIKRKDLADKILREQVHGSDPNLRSGRRINSVV